MKYSLPFLVWLITSFANNSAFSQVNIDYPSSRVVFQRDRDNNASIYISGSYTKSIDRIEAKLTAINGGQSTDWVLVQNNPQGGFYAGNMTGKGGWYELQVRGMKGNQEVGLSKLSPIGVGEVFIVAGQSNAQGPDDIPFDFGAQGASDDRVNCINYTNRKLPSADLPYAQFSHLDANSDISPRGKTAWCWGKLGDLLTARLQVPVLFYNVAWDGTIVRSWRESITGRANSPYVPAAYEPYGMPYMNLRLVLQNYVPITGLRGVLWLQGEGDNQFNEFSNYFQNLKTVIETSRNDTGLSNLSWMVSLTSYTNSYSYDDLVIQAQKAVISGVPNVFQGPNTDAIQIPRTDPNGVHFHHEGLTTLGEAWNAQLTDAYFSLSQPYQALSPLQVVATCGVNNTINLAVSNVGMTSVNWNTGQNSFSIQVGNGNYRAVARDNKSNVIYSPELRITEPIQLTQPVVRLEGSNPVCIGNTATLISSVSENVVWNTGSTSDRISITTSGEFFVTAKNIYGCEAPSAKTSVSVVNSPLPAKPVIAASGPVTFCDGGEVSLQSNSTVTNIWSTGARTAAIAVKSSGVFTVQALDALGCYSPVSDAVTVKVNPLPAKPVIAFSGPDTFCQGGNVSLSSNYDAGNTWSNNATTKAITISASGTFTVRQTDANGCQSSSDPATVKVNPLPAVPTISSLRPTTFCLRDYTTLRSSEAFSYVWSNGATSRDIEVRQSGNFTISAKDQNGCVSPVSAPVPVVVNPLPATPVITADGPTTFCADLSVNLQSTAAEGFLWSNGFSTQTLKVTTAGTYSVQTINQFKCYSDPSNQISTKTLALPPAPSIEALGDTVFCDGNSVTLQASFGANFIWTTGVEEDTIQVSESGSYSARVRDVLGCFSPYAPPIIVEVKTTPTIPTIKQTGVYTLMAENNVNTGDHVWKLNNTILPETDVTLKAIQSGSYVVNNSITYSPTLTCFSEFSEPFSFVADAKNNGLVAYPNPLTNGRLTLETLQNVSNATVQVIDSRGIILKSFNVNVFDKPQSFDISVLPAGLYFVRVISSTLNAAQKVIVVQ